MFCMFEFSVPILPIIWLRDWRRIFAAREEYALDSDPCICAFSDIAYASEMAHIIIDDTNIP